MKRLAITLFVVCSGVLLLAGAAHALTADEQKIADLRSRLAELQRQQDLIRDDLQATQEQKQTLQREITVMQNQIRLVQSQISSTEQKIDLTSSEIDQLTVHISDTQRDIDHKRAAIGRLITVWDERDRESLIADFFRFSGLSDFFHEVQEASTLNTRLLALVEELGQVRMSLEADQAALEDKKSGLEDLSEEYAQRKAGLDHTKYAKDRLLTTTQGQESAYQKQLAELEKQRASLFNELRETELKVVSGGLYIVHITASSVPAKGTKLFQQPLDGGRITQSYGMTAYAKRGAYGGAGHNGVDISAGYGSPIKAIGEGTVVAEGNNKGWGNWAAIQHPNNMTSVYAHMTSRTLKMAGSKVNAGTVIGYEGNTGNVTGAHLHLSLYSDFFTYLKESDGQLYFNYFEGSLNPFDYM